MHAGSNADRLRILRQYKKVAMVGLSSNPSRPSHFVAIYLNSWGYEVTAVNPREKGVLGKPAYASLKDAPGPIEIVDIFRDPGAVPGIVEEAIEVGAKVIWMQLGIVHEAAAQRAIDAGLEVVMDRCIKIEHARHFGGLSMMGLNTSILSPKKR